MENRKTGCSSEILLGPCLLGSEIVDWVAKRALKRDIIDIPAPFGRGEAKCTIKAIMIDVWQKRWTASPSAGIYLPSKERLVDQDSRFRLGRKMGVCLVAYRTLLIELVIIYGWQA
jgi:hypothetical protein